MDVASPDSRVSRYYAVAEALSHLRFLMCQDTEAGDEGFVALADMPALEHLSVGVEVRYGR